MQYPPHTPSKVSRGPGVGLAKEPVLRVGGELAVCGGWWRVDGIAEVYVHMFCMKERRGGEGGPQRQKINDRMHRTGGNFVISRR